MVQQNVPLLDHIKDSLVFLKSRRNRGAHRPVLQIRPVQIAQRSEIHSVQQPIDPVNVLVIYAE